MEGGGGMRGNGVFTSGTTCRRGACVGGERTNSKKSEKIEGWEDENKDREREVKECLRGRYGVVNMRKREIRETEI